MYFMECLNTDSLSTLYCTLHETMECIFHLHRFVTYHVPSGNALYYYPWKQGTYSMIHSNVSKFFHPQRAALPLPLKS